MSDDGDKHERERNKQAREGQNSRWEGNTQAHAKENSRSDRTEQDRRQEDFQWERTEQDRAQENSRWDSIERAERLEKIADTVGPLFRGEVSVALGDALTQKRVEVFSARSGFEPSNWNQTLSKAAGREAPNPDPGYGYGY